jgi:tRNA-2-methylthio-N6-dimethylallyladenosine synthase
MTITYFIDTYGCQMNVSDSETIRGLLNAAGFDECPSPESADAVLLISCAVREHAETRVLGRAAQLAGLRSHGRSRGPFMVLCGCVAQEHGSELLERTGLLDAVVGPDCYRDLPGILRERLRTAHTDRRTSDHYEDLPRVRSEFPRSFVTIMRGCDNWCSYCIVPSVRGPERSRESGRILTEVAGLSAAGYREITLLGQNVNSYRDGSTGFAGLLEAVARAADPAWIRFVTSHPRDLTRGVAEAMAGTGNICRQLHLPMQSGSDRVLAAMNRGYTSAQYMEKVAMLRELMPGIVLTTDIIAGFPGETQEEFDRTAGLLSEIGFDYAFLFRYSERRGTAAASMPGALPVEERLRRLHVLQDIQKRITLRRSAMLAGRNLRVLITGEARRPGQQAGRTMGNRMVILEGSSFSPGEFVDVTITRGDGWTHFGVPVGL